MRRTLARTHIAHSALEPTTTARDTACVQCASASDICVQALRAAPVRNIIDPLGRVCYAVQNSQRVVYVCAWGYSHIELFSTVLAAQLNASNARPHAAAARERSSRELLSVVCVWHTF